MMNHSELRERLLKYSYVDKDEHDAVTLMENAFTQALAVSPLYHKLKQARREGKVDLVEEFDDELESAFRIGVLTSDEVDQLKTARALQEEAIQVDPYRGN